MARTICGITYNEDQFHVDRERKTISAEASSLNDPLYEQLYDDAADVGFKIHNRRTGRLAVFYLTEIKRQDGDILSWEFAPSNEDIRRFPKLNGYTVSIFND